MNSKKRKLVGFLIIAFILIGVWYISYWLFSHKDADFYFPINFPIDSEAEAIAYVMALDSAMEMSPEKVGVWVAFDEESNIWEVGISSKQITDHLYLVRFYPNGTIISKGTVPTA